MKTKGHNQIRKVSKYTASMNESLSDLRLDFLGGTRLVDVDIFIESNSTVRMVRRIMEKRICQRYWSNNNRKLGNRDRQRMRRRISNHMIDIYGAVPSGFLYGV